MLLPFRDRQILIRSEQGVQHVQLLARHQVIATLAGLCLLLTAVGASVGAAVSVYKLSAEQDRVTELTVGYAQVIARAAANRSQELGLAAVAEAAGASPDQGIADRVFAENTRLRQALASLQADRERMIDQAAVLETRIQQKSAEVAALETSLDRAEESISSGNRRIAALEGDLRRDRAELDRFVTLASERASTLARLETALSQAENWNAALEAEVRELTDAVANAVRTAQEMADERDAMAHARDAAQARIGAIETGRREAVALMRAALNGAEGLRQERNAALAVLGSQQARSDRLSIAIDELVASQEFVFSELRERTDRQRRELADGLAQTGLDIDSMIDDVWAEMYPGVGGPFLPVSGMSFIDAEIWSRAASLTTSVEMAAATHELATRLPVAMPIRDEFRLSSRFGPRRDPFTGRVSGHLGLDFAAPPGTPIVAPAHGTVTFAGWRGAYGRLVEIDHGFGVTTRYAHLRRIQVEEGQSVATGEIIGNVGTTGRSTGPHLHYEVRVDDAALDPERFIEAGEHVLAVTQQE